jgi:hypothetical protein
MVSRIPPKPESGKLLVQPAAPVSCCWGAVKLLPTRVARPRNVIGISGDGLGARCMPLLCWAFVSCLRRPGHQFYDCVNRIAGGPEDVI